MDGKTLVIEPEGGVPDIIDLPEGVTLERRPHGALAFSYSRAKAGANDVLDAVKASGIIIGDVRSEEADLEDVFVELTSGK